MKRVKRLGISARLSLMVMALTAAAVIAMVAAIALRVNGFARQNAIEIATQTASARGTAVNNTLENALEEAKSLAKIFEAAGVVANAGISRRQANSLLQYYIARSPQFYGVYVAFEPNAYDGKDENFVDEWGHDSTGRFIPLWTRDDKGAGAIAPLTSYDASGAGDYYQIPRVSGHQAVTNPVIASGGSLMTSLSAPIFNKDRAFIGIAGVNLDLSGVDKMVATAVLYRTGTLTLYSSNDTVAGSKDTASLGKNITDVGADAALKTVIDKGDPFVLERTDAKRGALLTIGVPFPVGDTGTKWTIKADIPTAEVLGPVTSLIVLIIAVGVVAMILVIGAVLLIARSISRPLALAAAFAGKIAEGNLSATVDMGRRSDEIGALAEALNRMREGLRDMTRQVQDGASQLAAGTEELSSSAQQLAEGAQNQASTLEETSAAIEELSSSVEQVADHAQSQSRTVTDAAATMDAMLESVTAVSGTLGKVAASAGTSVERARQGASSVKQAIAAIKDISESSEKIAGIVTVISDIADQTNLLALNASIEAARAGEHGRGFAVVADEVSKLADRSASSTKEIGALIKETLKQVRQGVDLAEGSGRSMEEIITGTMNASTMVSDLQKSIEQQASTIRGIAHAVEGLSEMSAGITAATEEQTTNSRQVSKAIESVNEITQAAAGAAEQMASSVEEMAGMAQQLRGLVSRFQLDEEQAGLAELTPAAPAAPAVEASAG
jgi:methyl-accepting chemotaxis protein